MLGLSNIWYSYWFENVSSSTYALVGPFLESSEFCMLFCENMIVCLCLTSLIREIFVGGGQ